MMNNEEMFAYLYENKIIDSNLNIIEDENAKEDIDEEESEEEISIYKVLKLNKK